MCIQFANMSHTEWFSNALLYLHLSSHIVAIQWSVPEDRIVGGMEITIGQAPYLINLRQNGYFICGGSLLTAKCVLTAAHCVYGVEPRSLTLQAGVSRLSEIPPITRKVHATYVSDFYRPTNLDMDVAILRLNESIMLTKQVSTIKLCNSTPAVNTYVKISGWGLTSETAHEPADQLRSTNVRVISRIECSHAYAGRASLTSTMFCATVPGERDSCSGDSGGPVVQRNQVCGIVSWGFGCARAEYPGVYTNVASLRVKTFLKRTLDAHCTGTTEEVQ